MLKANVIKKWYKLTLKSDAGSTAVKTVQAESPAAAVLLHPPDRGWTLVGVAPL